MSSQELFFTIKYRTDGAVLSLDHFLHRGQKAMAEFIGDSIKIVDTSSLKPIATIPFQAITAATTGHGVIRISTKGQLHVLDFSSAFYQGLFAGATAKKRAEEAQHILTASGIEVLKKLL